jgi:inosose dehydratase
MAITEAGRQGETLHVATNQYPWSTFYRRAGRSFEESLEEGLAAVAASGADGFEGILDSPEDAEALAARLRAHGLEMRSFYAGGVLHRPEEVRPCVERIVAIAAKARSFGARIVVVNPDPIRGGGPAEKQDADLRVQAEALNRLGGALADLGMTLAYHNHDVELKNAAREFHHMLAGTDPARVSLCLDAHWIYRGSGDSEVALFDVVTLYGRRIVELHLRQSVDGVWTETFGDGEIDYASLARRLADLGVAPHLVLEQAVEAGSPVTLGAIEAHRRGIAFARRLFAAPVAEDA